MIQGRYYVIEVKMNKNNPLHRTIVRCVHEGKGILDFLDYEEYTRKSIKSLFHCQVISEIESMNK